MNPCNNDIINPSGDCETLASGHRFVGIPHPAAWAQCGVRGRGSSEQPCMQRPAGGKGKDAGDQNPPDIDARHGVAMGPYAVAANRDHRQWNLNQNQQTETMYETQMTEQTGPDFSGHGKRNEGSEHDKCHENPSQALVQDRSFRGCENPEADQEAGQYGGKMNEKKVVHCRLSTASRDKGFPFPEACRFRPESRTGRMFGSPDTITTHSGNARVTGMLRPACRQVDPGTGRPA